jgi:cyclopropane-fatty-acyl-phospholipid synthase
MPESTRTLSEALRPTAEDATAPAGAAGSPVDRLAARTVLGRLAELPVGRLLVRLPDGERRVLGGASPGPDAVVNVHHLAFFRRLLAGGDIGAGESYMRGEWSTPDPVEAARLFLANEDALGLGGPLGALRRAADRVRHLLHANTRSGSRRNVRAHYDLGNDLYRLFLDRTMTYSSALFEHPEQTLEDAQLAKYRALAEKAGLGAGDHVLEIGCGWGGFAEYAAGTLGCRITGITLSEEQARFATERMRRAGLSDRVEIRIQDYRDVEGRFDALVSIEMLEAVGHRFLDTFFAACDRLLEPRGRAVLQTITIPDQRYDAYRRGTDFIRTHVFPGGHLPSLAAVQDVLRRVSGFTIHDVTSLGVHYAETLRRWRQAFLERRDEARSLGFDEPFLRLWDFYLAICEAGFAHGTLLSMQLVLVRPGRSELPAGPYVGRGPGSDGGAS